MPKPCQSLAKALLNPCQSLAKSMPKPCQSLAKSMPKPCHSLQLSGILQQCWFFGQVERVELLTNQMWEITAADIV
jgi:hypothetical protein